MVEIEKIQLQSYMFAGIILRLPSCPLYFIVSKNCVVTFSCIDITQLPVGDEVCIITIPFVQDLSQMLKLKPLAYNAYAQAIGIHHDMCIEDILLYCEEYE